MTDLIELKIEQFVSPGVGMGFHKGKAVFVSGTMIGDTVLANIIKDKKNHSIARLDSINIPSNERFEIPCPYFFQCGGCDFMQLRIEKQTAYKKQFLKELIQESGLASDPEWVDSTETIHFRYRTNLKSHKGKIGYIARNTNELVAIKHCLILSEKINLWLEKLSNLGYHEAEFSILHGLASDQLSIYIKQGKELFLLPGTEETVIEDYGFGPMKLAGHQFAQSNPFITREIIIDVVENLNQSRQLLELYSGSGTFTLAMAKNIEKLWASEVNAYAVKLAKENMNLNHIKNANISQSGADKVKIKSNIDTIVVDPPRAGLSPVVRKNIRKSKASKMIYVSCNPASMLRDIKELTKENRFRLASITGYDMYGQSSHIEAMAVLEN